MDHHILSMEMKALGKVINRYLGETMPESAKEATGGNANIIIFLARNRDREIYQHTIEEKFCVTRSTASRVLALMEKKGLIVREPVAHDARLKRIVLTGKADAIVNDLKANGDRTEALLFGGFTEEEKAMLHDCLHRMRANIDAAQRDYELRHELRHDMRREAKPDMKPETKDGVSDAAKDTTKEEGK